MSAVIEIQTEQNKLWNGAAGHARVELQARLDVVFRPFEEILAAAVAPRVPGAVLDVGCGAGATTLALARRFGPGVECVGVDVSRPLVALARSRAARLPGRGAVALRGLARPGRARAARGGRPDARVRRRCRARGVRAVLCAAPKCGSPRRVGRSAP